MATRPRVNFAAGQCTANASQDLHDDDITHYKTPPTSHTPYSPNHHHAAASYTLYPYTTGVLPDIRADHTETEIHRLLPIRLCQPTSYTEFIPVITVGIFPHLQHGDNTYTDARTYPYAKYKTCHHDLFIMPIRMPRTWLIPILRLVRMIPNHKLRLRTTITVTSTRRR